jgi:hypothetical protein
MTTEALTPGPWMLYRLAPDSDPQERLIVVTADGETEICGVIHKGADARLIQQAPNLLTAAQHVIECWSNGDLAAAVRQLDDAVTAATWDD